MVKKLHLYYQKRAKEYELVYQKPERQADLEQLHEYLRTAFKNKYIREFACGTGYWTTTIAETAAAIFALDISEAVLEIAQSKVYKNSTSFQQMDFWNYNSGASKLDGVFGGFIWSHILKADLPRFLKLVAAITEEGGQLIFIDNKYVAGSSTPISRTDDDGNTYQIRRLQDGAEYEVLKNFPSKEEVKELIVDLGFKMEWVELAYFWILKIRKVPLGTISR